MAHVNFDKTIAHFATANVTSKAHGQKGLTDVAAGLQRLAEALHHDMDELLRIVKALEDEKRT